MKTGEFFNTYYLIDRLGHGGMSVVHLAFDVRSKQYVALKTLFSDLSADRDYLNRFDRETRVYRKLNHPNIVGLVEADARGPVAYIALEYVKGRSLADLIHRHPKGLPLPDALRVMEGLTNAVFHAHSRGVIHRDIQPNNVIVASDGTAKLIDFGIAYAEDEILHTETGTIMGTFVYCSPEQNQGKRVDERSDLYSLGLVLYELLTGQRGIKGDNLLEITEFQLRHTIPPAKSLRPEVPDALNDLVMRLLERWPENRHKYARDLIDDLIQLKVTSSFADLDLMFGSEYDVKLATAGKAYVNRRWRTAHDLCREVVAARPEGAAGHFLLGQILQAMGRGEEAAGALQRASSLEADNADYRLEHALCLYRLGREDEAVAQCDVILAARPDDRLALGLRGMLLSLARGGLRIDPASHQLTPTSPLQLPPGREAATPLDPDLDLVERYGILNHRVDRLDPDVAQLLSSCCCGLGELYSGAFGAAVTSMTRALAVLGWIMLLLLWRPSVSVDVYGFLETSCYQELVQQARAERLQEKVDGRLTALLRTGLRLASLPLFALLFLVWTQSRAAGARFHRRRQLYGRLSNVFRPDLIELQIPAGHDVAPGQSFVIIENNPFTAGRSRREALGSARVLSVGPVLAVAEFYAVIGSTVAPSAGDLALPADVLQAALLPAPALWPERPRLTRLARAYWAWRVRSTPPPVAPPVAPDAAALAGPRPGAGDAPW